MASRCEQLVLDNKRVKTMLDKVEVDKREVDKELVDLKGVERALTVRLDAVQDELAQRSNHFERM